MKHRGCGAMLMVCGTALASAGCRGDLADDLRDLLAHGGDHGTGGTCGGSGGGGGEQPPPVDPAPPRLIAPLSASLVSTAQPRLRWALPAGTDGAAIDVCADRACSNVIATISATGETATPPAPLPAGHVFWRARGTAGGVAGAASSPTWELFLPHRAAQPTTALATRADFDGDGYTDFVLDGRVLRGGPTGYAGSFDVPPGPADATLEVYVVAGDLNGDGFTDLLRVDQTAQAPYQAVGLWTPAPLLGGATGFTPGMTSAGTGPSGAAYQFLPAGDVNGDGYADVVIKTRFDARTWQGGAAGLTDGPVPVIATSQGFPTADGDVNGDGFSDAASNSNGETAFDFTPGSAAGFAASAASQVTLPRQPSVGLIAMLEVTGDSYADVAVTFPDGVQIFAGSPSGVASVPIVTLAGNTPTALAAGDFNGDGQPDLVVNDGGALEIHYGAGGVPGAAGVPLAAPSLPDVSTSRGAVGDVNGDGYDDLTVGAFALDATDQRYHVRTAVLHLGGPMGLDPTGTPAE
ncbi:MAG TPA: VCBS repeat-containing protein [Polyangia bacterium]|nr:VCBS repeat-containing protein [Polyangia bacterium]